MIQHIRIENYTLIENISIDVPIGFTAITGETGAGKSMFVGALSFLMGQRSDTSVLKDKTKKTIVEVEFNVAGYRLEPLFEELNLDYDNTCIIRREITPQGKSRAFVNDTPVSAAELKQVTSQLIDIHSQHSNILLQNSAFQLLIIDQYAQVEALLNQYKHAYAQWKQMQADLLRMRQDTQSTDRSYIEFLVNELENAHLQAGEQAELEEQLPALQHAQEIECELARCVDMIDAAPVNISAMLREVKQSMSSIGRYQSDYEEIAQRLQSQLLDIEDVAYELKRMASNIQHNPQEIERITLRLDELNRLEQKHHVHSEEELLQVYDHLNKQLGRILDSEFDEEKMQRAIAQKQQELEAMSAQISQMRNRVVPDIERILQQQLRAMNMPDAQVCIRMHTQQELTPTGIDSPEFMFNVNRGMEMQAIAKIASGGELSRIMLALKSLIIKKNVLPTIIFDEIDTGVSGEVSAKMGAVMKQIADNCQVISITHLPQVAAKAQQQMLIYKHTANATTITGIKQLTYKERVAELAKMISNEKVTEAAMLAAENLLNN